MKNTKQKCEDLVRRYDILNSISNIVATSRDLDRILRVTLKGVTFGDGFGFNRAILFLLDERAKTLHARMAIGTETAEEAWKIWQEIHQKNYSLEKFLLFEQNEDEGSSSLHKKIEDLEIPIQKGKILESALKDGNPRNVDISREYDAKDPFVITDRSLIEEEILDLIDFPRFCIIPLICRTKKVGIMLVDNKYNDREITREDCVFLMMLSQFAASSIRNTMIYNELREKINNLANLNYQIKILKEYNENIIESIHLKIFVVDNDFRITACNKNFADIIHLDKSAIIGKNIKDYRVVLDGMDLVDEITDVMQRGQVKKFRHVRLEMKGYEKDAVYNITLTILKNSKDKRYGVIVVINDVTRTVNLEKSLAEANRFSELGKLSASIAHEIRNPLIAIGGYANRIKRKYNENNALKSEDVDIIITEITRLERILHDILDYGSQKKSRYDFLKLDKVILDCLDLAEMSAEQKNIEIKFIPGTAFLRSVDLPVYGSYNNLKQGFINVLNNAIEASSKGQSVSLDLEIAGLGKQKTAIIKVNNPSRIQNGKDINDVFTPFYSTKLHGTGLGLSITKKIIEEHFGSISVESKADTGTTFMIHLPLSLLEDNMSKTKDR